MEKSPGNAGILKQEDRKQMSDVATANFLVEQIGGKRHVGDMLRTALRELNRRYPHRTDPKNKWTERRLRGWWNNESQIVRHFQMVELYETAEALRRARNEHSEFIEKTARIRSMALTLSSDADGRMAED